MKTIILTAIMALTVLSTDAKSLITDYVVTDDGISYFKSVKYTYGDAYLVGLTESGVKVKFIRDDIKSFRKDGDVFNKTKLIEKGNACDNCVFMRLIDSRHGFSLYLYDCLDNNGEPMKRCFVYKEDQKVLEVDNKNYKQIISFFSLRYN
jgi:hypothetical protein